tara:strand:- start:9909 stop:10535 length:627 start_codon:yes stop_codon:yes gene_type:complete
MKGTFKMEKNSIKKFENIYKGNLWGGRQSRSGSGSDLEETSSVSKGIVDFIKENKVMSVLDIPCGDMNWMKGVLHQLDEEVTYIGADIVKDAVTGNIGKFKSWEGCEVSFEVMDLTADNLPKVDLIIARDCLGHLSEENILKSMQNIYKAEPKFFAATNWPTAGKSTVSDAGWMPINMRYYRDVSKLQFVDSVDEYFDGKKLTFWKTR